MDFRKPIPRGLVDASNGGANDNDLGGQSESLGVSQYHLMIIQPIFVIWMNAETILLALRQDPEIAHLAGLYLKWLSLGLPGYAFNAVLR